MRASRFIFVWRKREIRVREGPDPGERNYRLDRMTVPGLEIHKLEPVW
jgi:hypothetical protein